MNRKQWKRMITYVAVAAIAVLLLGLVSVSAASVKTGFVTQNGKTYYIDKDGSKHKGWLELNGKKYYFNKTTGVQLKGWAKDSSGKIIRYFTSGSGVMVTGYLTDTKGNTRYFDPETGLLTRGWMTDSKGYKYYFTSGSGVMAKGWLENSKGEKRYFNSTNGRMRTGWVKNSNDQYRFFDESSGIMYTGLKKIDGDYYYFAKSNGIRYQKGFGTVGSKHYYFSPADGKAQIGWLELDGKKYYFSTSGVMYENTTLTVDGKVYKFDENGVATESAEVINGKYIKVYDGNNNREYYVMKEYLTHPGIADKTVSDLDLLAAVCESEAGDQGLVGMKAVALCILNRTIAANKEFPSEIRYVVYQGNPLQYAVVTDGALLKRLNGQYYDRELAYQAAKEAMDMFEKYKKNGTPRTLPGFDRKDFNFMYFMMESSYWNMNLNFSKVDNFLYKDHMFFVDWVV